MGVAREHCDNILENVHVLRQTMMGKSLVQINRLFLAYMQVSYWDQSNVWCVKLSAVSNLL